MITVLKTAVLPLNYLPKKLYFNNLIIYLNFFLLFKKDEKIFKFKLDLVVKKP